MVRRTNYKTIQAGRGFAALAVLLFHTNLVLALPKYFGAEPAPLFRAGNSGVEFFFVLSGLVMVLAHQRELGGENSPFTFLWKRFRRIYPPLWVALAAVLVSMIAAPAISPGGLPSLNAILGAFAVSPAEKEPLLAVEWTLRHETLFYILFAITLWRPRIGAPLFGAWFLASVAAAALHLSYPLAFFIDPIHLLFFMGIAAALWFLRHELDHESLFIAGGAVLFFAMWAGVALGDLSRTNPAVLWAYGLGASAMLLGFMSLERRDAVKVPASLTFLGEASYSIYLVHFPIVSAAAKLSMICARHTPLPLLIWYMAVVALALIGGICFHLAIERPLLRIGARLSARAPTLAAAE